MLAVAETFNTAQQDNFLSLMRKRLSQEEVIQSPFFLQSNRKISKNLQCSLITIFLDINVV